MSFRAVRVAARAVHDERFTQTRDGCSVFPRRGDWPGSIRGDGPGSIRGDGPGSSGGGADVVRLRLEKRASVRYVGGGGGDGDLDVSFGDGGVVTAGSNGGGFDVARTLLAGAEKSPRETNPRADARAFGHRAPRLDEDEMFVVHARVVARRGTGGRVPDAPGAGDGDVHERELTPEGVSTSHDALSAHLLAQNLRGGGGWEGLG